MQKHIFPQHKICTPLIKSVWILSEKMKTVLIVSNYNIFLYLLQKKLIDFSRKKGRERVCVYGEKREKEQRK